MSLRTSTTSALACVAVLATVPAIAHADLAGAPTLRVVNAEEVALQIPLDAKLAPKGSGVDVRVVLAGKRLGTITPAGRHGGDFLYRGTAARDGFVVGRKYTVKITVPGEQAVTRSVKLIAKK